MPLLPLPVVLAMRPGLDLDGIARLVSAPVSPGAVRSTDRILVDTFDGRLRRRGLQLWREPARVAGSSGAVRLALHAEREASLSAVAVPARKDRILLSDLPPGPLQDRLGPLVDVRALLPLVRVRSRVEPLVVCNGDGKTVVRLAVETPAVASGRSAVPLARRLVVTPVRGYDRDFDQVVRRLTAKGRLTACPHPVAEEALRAAALPLRGVSADIDVELKGDMRAHPATLLIARRLAEVVEANMAGTLADLDPEFLHDLRVAVRRTRSVLKEMKGVLVEEPARRSRADLRWIQEITGPTRDLDVLLQDWPAMIAPVPAPMAADLRPLRELLESQRAAEFDSMRKQLRSRRFALAWEAWRSLIGEESDGGRRTGPNGGTPIGRMAGRRIDTVYRAMVEMGSAVTDESPPEALHDLRKRGKELRYLLELFGGMWPADRVKPLVSALKGLQDVLGHFQDDEIQVKELRSLGPALAATPGGTDSLIALGFVIDGLSISQRQARADFGVRFAAFAAPETRDVIAGTFAPVSRGGRKPARDRTRP